MSNGQVPGPLGRNGNTQSIDDGTLRRSLSHVPGVLGTSTDVSTQPMVRPPLLPTSAGVKPPPTIQFGSRGPLVERLQQLLNERLVPSPQLAINGTFDAAVIAAVKQYQQYLRLTVDGRVGKDTWYRLHKGDLATIAGTPKVVTQSVAPTKPNISTWTLEQKFTRVLERTPPKLPGHMREEFMKLLDPMSLAIIVGTLIVWAASHAFGIGAVIDIVMLIGGVVFIGMAALDAAKSLYDFLTLTCTADKEADLDQAAVLLAKAVSILGVGAFTALVTKGAAKRFAKKAPIPEQKPLMKEPGPKLAAPKAEPSPGLHSQEWEKIETKDFKTHRKIDMKNLSPTDKKMKNTLLKQGRPEKDVEQLLRSGDKFRTKELSPGDKLYGFDTKSRTTPKSQDSMYWMDEASYKDVKLKYCKDGAWDKEGVKNYLALPCYNRADVIDTATVTKPHIAVESTISTASEQIGYTRADQTTGMLGKIMPGGGTQLTPDRNAISTVSRLYGTP